MTLQQLGYLLNMTSLMTLLQQPPILKLSHWAAIESVDTIPERNSTNYPQAKVSIDTSTDRTAAQAIKSVDTSSEGNATQAIDSVNTSPEGNATQAIESVDTNSERNATTYQDEGSIDTSPDHNYVDSSPDLTSILTLRFHQY